MSSQFYDYPIANARIQVSSNELETGYSEGFDRFHQDYPTSFPTDQQISTFIQQHCSATSAPRNRAGYILGWCAGLLSRSLFIALPTDQPEGKP